LRSSAQRSVGVGRGRCLWADGRDRIEPGAKGAGRRRCSREFACARRLSHHLSVFGKLGGSREQGQGARSCISYASPGTISAYRKDGRFPDGAVLVKEVVQAATDQMTTGAVSRAETLKGWFVMMKDRNNRHAGNKLWGDGWGWSWFDAANPSKTTSTDYKIDCQSCHVPAQASDWVYVGGYPPLRR
jgi:hypothetical protein